MWIEILLSAAIETALGLLAEVGFGDELRELKTRLSNKEVKQRQQAFDNVFQAAKQTAGKATIDPLLEHRPFQEEVVKGLLDPVSGFDAQVLAEFWGEKYPEHAVPLRRFFSTLETNLLADKIWGPILVRFQTFRTNKIMQDKLAERNLDLPPQEIVKHLTATLQGNGAIAQGDGAKAVGAGGILIEGGVNNIVQYIIEEHRGGNFNRDARDLRQIYLGEVIAECNRLPWTIMRLDRKSSDVVEDIHLSDVFIDLHLAHTTDINREEEHRELMRMIQEEQRITAQKAVNDNRRLLIMGDPGSGKSTLVKRLAYLQAQATLSEHPDQWLQQLSDWEHGALLPVYIELRIFAADVVSDQVKEGSAHLILDHLESILGRWKLGDFWSEIDRVIRQPEKPMLFIFDGLDEVPTDHRQIVVDSVNNFVSKYKEHRFLVTCRPYAYIGQPWKLRNFPAATLAPFDERQIDQFVKNWFQQMAEGQRMGKEEASNRATNLQQHVRRKDLRGIAERPLLLTVMAQLDKMPEDRIELFAQAVDLLLDRWESRYGEEKGLLEKLDIPGFKKNNLEEALYEVAFNAHQAGPEDRDRTADIDEKELVYSLKTLLGNDLNKAELFVEYIRERAGLLIRHKTDAYTFPHRLFQEFLAACFLTTKAEYASTATDLLLDNYDLWREVFIIAAGNAARIHQVDQAISAVNKLALYTPEENVEIKDYGSFYRQMRLAGESLLEIGMVNVHNKEEGRLLLKRIIDWLLIGLDQENLPAPQRAACGVSLAKLGDPRSEVNTLEEMQFCAVPAGPFRMGEGRGEHEVDLPFYIISRFPVTNAQYEFFVESKGYEDVEYWQEAQAAGFWEAGQFKGRYDNQPRNQPIDFGEPYRLANHPVVGVSWYEVLAFTRWLTDHWQAKNLLQDGWQARLPSEAQWEKAARGGLLIPKTLQLQVVGTGFSQDGVEAQSNPIPSRVYPWEGEFDINKVNSSDTGIDATSAVGSFSGGASPYGVEELGGNIWEWCSSLCEEYPYDAEDGREDLTSASSRVLRGGAFYSDTQYVRCACRGHGSPDYGYYNRGFRVIVFPLGSGN